jgi:hypothetical protein
MFSFLNFFVIFSDTKNQLQQEVEELQENMARLSDQLNLKIDSGIQMLASIIESLKNADSVLTNNQKDAALRFYVETKQGDYWPENTFINYETELTDTHNTMNTETGFFTAPFSGTYGFVFYARIYCDITDRYLYVDHNGARSNIHSCHGGIHSSHISISINFALSLNQGDTVGIFTGTAFVRIDPHPAKFTGFLLQKN